ncbi:MAG: tRNA dihydrouridine(20/20a) synthase DusA [Steroidobacteraceae bacterium]
MPIDRLDRRLSVAPMMDWTDRHCRYFLRQFSPTALLYTEMVVARALVHGDRHRLLSFSAAEQPLALQLGGSDPGELAMAARLGEDFGYLEINLNVGCPSDRVQGGQFGACLMDRPALVADCVAAIRQAVSLPVTVKTRIGIDDREDEQFLEAFVRPVAEAGCATFIIHARKAILSGLTPKQNREIPPLNHERACWLKARFPGLEVILNGGLVGAGDIRPFRSRLDGFMIGRAAYHDPWVLSALHRELIDPDFAAPECDDIVARMAEYAGSRLAEGVPLRAITRHMLGMMNGRPGARAWRRLLSESAAQPGADGRLLQQALRTVEVASH